MSWPSLITLLALILFWRSHDLLFHPTMRVEDGAKVFASFFEHRELEHVFRFKSGYMPLLPNLVGYLVVRLPLRASPYLMTVLPTALSLFTYASFFAKPFRSVVADDRVRFAACLALALAPVGQFYLVSHTDFSIWNALFCVLLWSWVPLPPSFARAGLAVIWQELLVWTHPLSFVAAPLNVLQLRRSSTPAERWGQASMLVGHVAHVAFGLDRRRAGRALGFDIGELVLRSLEYLSRSIERALVGPGLESWLREQGPVVNGALTLLFVAVIGWVVAKNLGGMRAPALLAAYGVLAVTTTIVASKTDHQIDHGIRYLYVQSLFCVLLACFVALPLIERVVRRFASSVALDSPALAMAPVLLIFAAQNFGATSRYVERKQGDNAERVAECMTRLAALQTEHGGPCGFSLTCEKTNDWPISVELPACRR